MRALLTLRAVACLSGHQSSHNSKKDSWVWLHPTWRKPLLSSIITADSELYDAWDLKKTSYWSAVSGHHSYFYERVRWAQKKRRNDLLRTIKHEARNNADEDDRIRVKRRRALGAEGRISHEDARPCCIYLRPPAQNKLPGWPMSLSTRWPSLHLRLTVQATLIRMSFNQWDEEDFIQAVERFKRAH